MFVIKRNKIMYKNFLVLLIIIFLQGSNAFAGSDGEKTLNNEKTKQAIKTKDCFEKLNRMTFSFNQGLDKALLKPIAEGYRKLPEGVQTGTSNAVRNLSNLMKISIINFRLLKI